MTNRFREQEISLSNLKLDPDNSRHEHIDSQVEIIEWMTDGGRSIGSKLYNLAKDIVTHGLNPSDRISVIEDASTKGKCIVMEGNRRVTALKLLQNPGTAPTEAWKSKFGTLSKTKGFTPITKVPCVIYNNLDDVFHFMELKHMGESSGRGTVQWDAYQKARHDTRKNKRHRYHKALTLLEHVKNNEKIYGGTFFTNQSELQHHYT
ncbi:MAG: hypothetical protein OQK94_04795 [Gammaproteobacteria bacterium]|nr:hypothetical protein [Gammaproteobacteria bacterium]MCW8840188.1 hypothetical protein [Gammaproteobacteria bacterium]MCW8959447.1 hypothetical protein [Gammaproteobacteria bacterium]MCW8992293.1 hypothetical protein [Gammaproteobacteria bacterium]